MANCVILECKNNEIEKEIKLFSFPNEYNKRKFWADLLGLGYDELQTAKICENHFEDKFKHETSSGQVELAIDAIPSLELPIINEHGKYMYILIEIYIVLIISC